jgi:2-C-methyl-D-erythritol 4-phosphate cytidylyltransferase
MAAGEAMSGPHPVWAIVLAAGSGARFGQRKQFVTAGGRRLVDLAVERALEECDHVVLVLPQGERWSGPSVEHVVEGGADRGASVRAGLAAIPDAHGTVVVHQAANPLAGTPTFHALIEAIADGAPAAFPGLRPADIVRAAEGDLAGEVLGRDELVLVQVPAAFRLEVLRAAHAAGEPALEDTALVSAAGFDVRIVPGDPRNIHVATPEDLEVVEALLHATRG